LINLKGKAQPK